MFNTAVVLATAFSYLCQVSASVVDKSTDCNYFATRTSFNSTHVECDCDSDYTGNGTICALLAQLDCKSDVKDGFAFKVYLNQSYIDYYGYSPDSLTFLNASCSEAVTEEGYYVLTSPTYDDCGTIRTNTSDEIVYSNVVVSNGRAVSTGDIFYLPFSCMVMVGVREQTVPTQVEFYVSGETGNVVAQIFLYQDANYTNLHGGIPVLKFNDTLYVEIALESRIDALTLIARRCWATAEATYTPSKRFNIIEEPGCLNAAALNAKLTSNGVLWYARFEFQVFAFLPQNVAYIHCDIELCHPSDGRSCQPTCGASGRRKGSGNSKRIRSSAIHRANKKHAPPIVHSVASSDDEAHESDTAGIDMMRVVLVVVAVLVMVIIVNLVVYICRTRKSKSSKGNPLPKAHVTI